MPPVRHRPSFCCVGYRRGLPLPGGADEAARLTLAAADSIEARAPKRPVPPPRAAAARRAGEVSPTEALEALLGAWPPGGEATTLVATLGGTRGAAAALLRVCRHLAVEHGAEARL
jgi:hypothetical protein